MELQLDGVSYKATQWLSGVQQTVEFLCRSGSTTERQMTEWLMTEQLTTEQLIWTTNIQKIRQFNIIGKICLLNNKNIII